MSDELVSCPTCSWVGLESDIYRADDQLRCPECCEPLPLNQEIIEMKFPHLQPEEIRRGLNLVCDLGSWISKFTPTAKDDQAFEFLRLLANTPGAIEKTLELVRAQHSETAPAN